MGGSVNVTIREKNGKVTRMCRWTNNLRYWFQTPEFRNNPNKVLRAYIKAGDDSGYNHDEALLAPDGYGLIVIDAVNKVILSHQDYTDLGMYHGIKMLLDLHIHDCFDKKAKDSPIPYINLEKLGLYQKRQKEAFGDLPGFQDNSLDKELKNMKKHYDLFMSGAIQIDLDMKAHMEEKEKKKWFKSLEYKRYLAIGKILSKKNKTNKDWLDFILYTRRDYNFNFFKIDLAGYHVINFDPYGKKGYLAFMDKLKELGFRLTKKDKAGWDECLQDEEE